MTSGNVSKVQGSSPGGREERGVGTSTRPLMCVRIADGITVHVIVIPPCEEITLISPPGRRVGPNPQSPILQIAFVLHTAQARNRRKMARRASGFHTRCSMRQSVGGAANSSLDRAARISQPGQGGWGLGGLRNIGRDFEPSSVPPGWRKGRWSREDL